jgi:hypothetical protein
MNRHSPNDTRYPFAAIASGLVATAGVAGGLFLVGIATPIAGMAGVSVGTLLAASIKYT